MPFIPVGGYRLLGKGGIDLFRGNIENISIRWSTYEYEYRLYVYNSIGSLKLVTIKTFVKEKWKIDRTMNNY